jgi:hypothetical protein
MKYQRFGLVIVLLVMVASQPGYGQESLGPRPKKARTPADYQPRTLKEIAARDSETRSRGGDHEGNEKVIVNGDIRPSRVRATYAGRARPLPQSKKDVLHRWAQLYAGAPEHYNRPYQSELLFKEDGIKYWLAVRKDSVAQFEKEVKAGQLVDLFLIRLGGALDGDKWEALLLVENFQKPK